MLIYIDIYVSFHLLNYFTFDKSYLQIHVRARKIPVSTLNNASSSDFSDPYIARVCGLFVRDKSDLALVDICNEKDQYRSNKDSRERTIDPTLFMASLGTRTINEDDSEESLDSNDKIKMGKSRNGSIIIIDFKGRKRFVRINLDDTKGISITLQVSISLN